MNANSLIELVAVEREMSPGNPLLLSCSAKDSSLVSTQMDNGKSTLVRVSGGLGIDYGCGIGPKIVLSGVKEGVIAVLNQRRDSK